jgi:hypothetical protein
LENHLEMIWYIFDTYAKRLGFPVAMCVYWSVMARSLWLDDMTISLRVSSLLETFRGFMPAGERLMKVGGFVLDDLQGLHISQGDPMLMASFRCDSGNLKPHVWLFSGPRNQQIHLFLLLDHWNVGMPFLYLVCRLFHFVGDTKSPALRFSEPLTTGPLQATWWHFRTCDRLPWDALGCQWCHRSPISTPNWTDSCTSSGLEDWQNCHITIYGAYSIIWLYIIPRFHNTC